MPGKLSKVLAIGAAGRFAGLVVPELAKRGAHVRGMVQDMKQAGTVREHGAAEVVAGDIRDRASLGAAMEGVGAVFYIAPAFLPNEAEVGKAVVVAAKQAGVRRFVFSSVIHSVLSALVNHAAKAPVEEAILNSGMEYALLHPALFFQNYAQGWAAAASSGTYAEPWSAETRFSRVDYRDVAEAAAIALTGDRLLFGTFELCAEGHLNRRDVVALMSEALGRTIKADSLSPAKIAASGNAGSGQATPMQAMFKHYDHHGLLGKPLTLRAILGREPTTLRAYFAELAAAPQPAR